MILTSCSSRKSEGADQTLWFVKCRFIHLDYLFVEQEPLCYGYCNVLVCASQPLQYIDILRPLLYPENLWQNRALGNLENNSEILMKCTFTGIFERSQLFSSDCQYPLTEQQNTLLKTKALVVYFIYFCDRNSRDIP